MEIIYIIITVLIGWFIFRQIKLRYLSKIIDTFEVEYIKQIKKHLENKALYLKSDSNIYFQEIYHNHFSQLLANSKKDIEEYELQSSLMENTININIELEYAGMDSYITLNRKDILNNIEIVSKDKKSNRLHLRAKALDFLRLVIYVDRLTKDAFPHNDDERYVLEHLLLSLKKKLIGFRGYWINKRTIWSVTKMMDNDKDRKESFLVILLELLKYEGKHSFDDYTDVTLFTHAEMDIIRNTIDCFIAREIVNHDFKYINQLIAVVNKVSVQHGNYRIDGLEEIHPVKDSLLFTIQNKDLN